MLRGIVRRVESGKVVGRRIELLSMTKAGAATLATVRPKEGFRLRKSGSLGSGMVRRLARVLLAVEEDMTSWWIAIGLTGWLLRDAVVLY